MAVNRRPHRLRCVALFPGTLRPLQGLRAGPTPSASHPREPSISVLLPRSRWPNARQVLLAMETGRRNTEPDQNENGVQKIVPGNNFTQHSQRYFYFLMGAT